ncbi:hypothetical protein Asd1617_04328 [Shigella dysenteriae 1617]|uniref:Uncharacterized protein n=1 Tax=Shigella dysenteriae 1617 TaxID=754093 RepID=A0A0A6ZYZ3_SHIDY|nr:hypothetical protein Asd1617_04328 [Shigella dysenteriae 1617]
MPGFTANETPLRIIHQIQLIRGITLTGEDVIRFGVSFLKSG